MLMSMNKAKVLRLVRGRDVRPGGTSDGTYSALYDADRDRLANEAPPESGVCACRRVGTY